MATPPEGAETPGVGNWTTVEIALSPVITDAVGVIRSVLDVLVQILNVALTILEVTKALLPGNLDAISSLVESIIEEIEGIINDLRDIGLYVTGDWNLLQPDFQDLRGGYQAFERRMIGRFTNTTDPSRPDFSRSSAVVAIYLYLSVDISAIQALIVFVQKIMGFFGTTLPMQAYTQPVGLEVTYGIEGAPPSSLGTIFTDAANQETPNEANLRWQMAPSNSATEVAFPRLAPPGFLIEVSVVRDGLYIGWSARKKNAGTTDNRVDGLVLDPSTGQAFRLYGGADVFDAGDMADVTFKEPEDGNEDTETRVYAFKDITDNTPIPINALIDDQGRHLLQRAFFATGSNLAAMAPGQGFSGVLKPEDMPYNATFEVDEDGNVTAEVGDQARDVYVRISALSANLAGVLSVDNRPGNTGPLASPYPVYKLDSSRVNADVAKGGQVYMRSEQAWADKTAPSEPLTVTFASDTTNEYIETVATALAVMVLSRADLPIHRGSPKAFIEGAALLETGLEGVAETLMPKLISRDLEKYFNRKEVSPARFRGHLRRKCISLANYLYETTGAFSPELEASVVETGRVLREWEFPVKFQRTQGPYTIWDALNDNDPMRGLGLNPYGFGVDAYTADVFFIKTASQGGNAYVPRRPSFMFKGEQESFRGRFSGPWAPTMGSADMSPVVYARNINTATGNIPGEIGFVRNIFEEAKDQGDDLFAAAAAVLNVAASSYTLPAGDSEWLAIRPFETGIPGVEIALDELLRWIKTIEAGAQSIVDLIESYIEFVEARLLELQALVQRIDALLALIEDLELPVVNGLITTGRGTYGAMEGLVTAGNKPADDVDAYGAGVVILAGGLPAVLIDILQAFFSGGED